MFPANMSTPPEALSGRWAMRAVKMDRISNLNDRTKANAHTTLKEPYFYRGCFLLDEKNHLRGPPDPGQCIDAQAGVMDQVRQIPEKCKRSFL